MIIEPRASNAILIRLENGDEFIMHEVDNTLSFSSMPSFIKVTAHNIKTMDSDTLGKNYQISLMIAKGEA